jgi:hypothetical protein
MITKQYLKDRVQYMHNVTFGRVAAKELDAAISAFVKGYAEGTK